MIEFKLTRQVERRKKRFFLLLSRLMVLLIVLFVLLGIIFESGYFLPAFFLAALYYLYTIQSDSSYEYVFDNDTFTIFVIKGKRRRKTAHVLSYQDLEVVAPPDHELVARYKRKGGTERIRKFDYTSYRDDVPYYTMIIREDKQKIKLLLDLDQEVLQALKLRYPQKVFRA